MFEVTSAITRRWFIVVGTAVAGLILSGLIGLLARTSTYTARSQVLVDQPLLVPDSAGASVPTKFGSLLPTFCRFALGDQEAGRIASAAQLSPGIVSRDLNCTPITGTTVLLLSAHAPNAREARDVARASASTLAADLTDRYRGVPNSPVGGVQAEVLTAASGATRNPQHLGRELALGLAGGLFAGLVFIVASESFLASPSGSAETQA